MTPTRYLVSRPGPIIVVAQPLQTLCRLAAMATSLYHPHRLLLDTQTQMPAASVNETRPSGPYADDANFDSNMVIILAALLCALICALGLNSIVRCALRCSTNRFAFETPEQVAERLAATGLKKNALSQIPVVVYGSSSEQNIPATDCPICLGEFVQGEKVRILPKCNHGFHVKCIDTWLVSRSSCPTCRQTLCDQNSASSNEEELVGGRIRSPLVYGSGGQHGLVVIVQG